MNRKPKLRGLRGSSLLPTNEREERKISNDILNIPFIDWVNIEKVMEGVPTASLLKYDPQGYLTRIYHALGKLEKSENPKLSKYAESVHEYYCKKDVRARFHHAYVSAKEQREEVIQQERVVKLKRKVILQGEGNAAVAALVGGKKLRRELSELSKDGEYVDDNASSVTDKSDSPTHIYDQPLIDSPFVSEPGRGASLIQSNIDIKMKHKVFSLTPPNYGLHSPNKPKLTDQQQQRLSSLVDVVIRNTPNVKIPEDLLEETTRIRGDQLCNKNLTAMPVAKQFLINVLNEPFESFVTKIWSFDPPEATPTTEKQFIQAMQYTLTDFHSKASLDTFGAAHERTFFINHIVPPFTYFGNHTQLLRFYWCEKAMKHRSYSNIDTSVWSKASVRKADGLGVHRNHEFLIIEASSNGQDENIEHSVDDTIKQIDSTTGALKYLILQNLSAKYATLQKVQFLGIHSILDKITLTSTSLKKDNKYRFSELRTAQIPIGWDTRKRWVKMFEVLATMQVILREQIEILSALEDESNGLVDVNSNETVRHVLMH